MLYVHRDNSEKRVVEQVHYQHVVDYQLNHFKKNGINKKVDSNVIGINQIAANVKQIHAFLHVHHFKYTRTSLGTKICT